MDPNPIKHPAVLLARVRDELEPALCGAGFRFDRRNNPPSKFSGDMWIDYRRGTEILGLRWERWNCRLAAELLDSKGNVLLLAEATTAGTWSHEELTARLTSFVQTAEHALLELSTSLGLEP